MANFDINDLLGVREPILKLNLDDFLNTIDDSDLKERVISLFLPYEEVIFNINALNGIPNVGPAPEIVILKNCLDVTISTAFGGRIEMSDSYIYSCLDVDIPDFKEVVDDYADELNVEGLAPIITMMWSYSHEYHHHIRKHNEVEERLREIEGDRFDKTLTDYAFESDSDQCAIAVVYRYLQVIHGDLLPDLMCRQLALYLVFWTMRPHVTLTHGFDHLSMGVRLANLAGKLAIVTERLGSSELPDIDFVQEISRTRLHAIAACLGSCERLYLRNYDITGGVISLKALVEQGEIGGADSISRKVVKRWDEIRALVSEVSGTRA